MEWCLIIYSIYSICIFYEGYEIHHLITFELNIPYNLPENLNIYEIMYIESQSKCFIGTSLHGNITAISYEVNNIGIDKSVKKLDEFLKTWSLHKNNNDVV